MPENETIVKVGIVPAKDGLIKIVLSESKPSSLFGAKAASGAKYDVVKHVSAAKGAEASVDESTPKNDPAAEEAPAAATVNSAMGDADWTVSTKTERKGEVKSTKVFNKYDLLDVEKNEIDEDKDEDEKGKETGAESSCESVRPSLSRPSRPRRTPPSALTSSASSARQLLCVVLTAAICLSCSAFGFGVSELLYSTFVPDATAIPVVDFSTTTGQDDAAVLRWPESVPLSGKYAVRKSLAAQYLAGDGIEIGAKQSALLSREDVKPGSSFLKQWPPRASTDGLTVRLVDELSTDQLLHKYAAPKRNLTKALLRIHMIWETGIQKHPVDVVDDASTLATFEDESLDFVIACHVLEHVPSFLGTLSAFARVLRRGGYALIALPDKRIGGEDQSRATTMPDTHLREWRMDASALTTARIKTLVALQESRRQQKLGTTAAPFDAEGAAKRIRHRLNTTTGVHLHTFTTESIAETFVMVRREGFPMALVALQQVANEDILVLQKLTGHCPAHTRLSAPSLLGGCPPRGRAQGKFASSGPH